MQQNYRILFYLLKVNNRNTIEHVIAGGWVIDLIELVYIKKI